MEINWVMNAEVMLLFFGIIAATFIIATIFSRLFGNFIRKSSASMQSDPTNYQFLRHFLTAIIYIVGFGVAIHTVPSLRMVASSMLAGAGILAVAVGFASQQALSNIVSGVFIILFKPFRVNDRLRIRDTLTGVVEDITLRHTVIRDFRNRRIIIPNSIIGQEVIINSNFNDEKIRKWLEIGISYESDVDRARAIILEEALKHPLHIDGRTPAQIEKGKPDVLVRVIELGDYAVKLRAYIWAKNTADAFAMGCDLLEILKKRFPAEGIEIPSPQQTLVLKRDVELPVQQNIAENGK
jgi:small-conductance mechanosensitive channel